MTYQEGSSIKRVNLPKDNSPHILSDLEWWYCYAFLEGSTGSKYAVIVSFFSAGLFLLKGHYLIFSLIDLSNNLYKGYSLLDKYVVINMNLFLFPHYLLYCPTNKNVWNIALDYLMFAVEPPHRFMDRSNIKRNPVRLIYGDNSLIFTGGTIDLFNIHIKESDVDISLCFSPTKTAALIGGSGKPNQLYYYSYTNNKVSGYIVNGSLKDEVTGKGWFDHQWGFSNGVLSKMGWIWFGLQLDDGRELLINEFYSYTAGEPFSPSANLIEKDGSLRFTAHINLEPLYFFESSAYHTFYPLEWNINIPDFCMELKVTALFPEQEIPIPFPLQAIWEGACNVSGIEKASLSQTAAITGRGFIELVGYANYECC